MTANLISIASCVRAVENRVFNGAKDLTPTLELLRWFVAHEEDLRTIFLVLKTFPGAEMRVAEDADTQIRRPKELLHDHHRG